MQSIRPETDEPQGEAAAIDPLFAATPQPSERTPARDLARVIVLAIFIGVGLTSWIMAALPMQASTDGEHAGGVIELLSVDAPTPDEIWLVGGALEDTIINGMPSLRGVPVRAVAADTPLVLDHDRVGLVHRDNQTPILKKKQAPQRLGSHEGLVIDVYQGDGPRWLRAEVDRARAVLTPHEEGEPVLRCDQWWFDRRGCGGASWIWFGVANVRVNKKDEKCIWAHPKRGYDLQVSFEDITLPRPMRARFALSDVAVQTPKGGAVDVRVLVDDKEVFKGQQSNRKGWRMFKIPAQTQPVTLTWIISAENDGRRHFCFDGEIKAP